MQKNNLLDSKSIEKIIDNAEKMKDHDEYIMKYNSCKNELISLIFSIKSQIQIAKSKNFIFSIDDLESAILTAEHDLLFSSCPTFTDNIIFDDSFKNIMSNFNNSIEKLNKNIVILNDMWLPIANYLYKNIN